MRCTVRALTSACPRRRSIIYYSTKIFQQAGFESKSAAIGGTVAMGLVKLLFETHSLLNLDHAGRRPLLLLGAAFRCGGAASSRVPPPPQRTGAQA